MWEWILKMWNNSESSMKLNSNEFVGMGTLSSGSTFNVTTRGIIKGSNSLVGLLAQVWTKKGPEWVSQKCHICLGLLVKEGIQRLREMEMLELICHLRPTSPCWEDPGDIVMCPPQINMLKCLPPLPQKLTSYGNWILTEVIKLTWGH